MVALLHSSGNGNISRHQKIVPPPNIRPPSSKLRPPREAIQHQTSKKALQDPHGHIITALARVHGRSTSSPSEYIQDQTSKKALQDTYGRSTSSPSECIQDQTSKNTSKRKHKQASKYITYPDLQAQSSDLQGKTPNTRPQRKPSKTLMDTLLRRLPMYAVEVPALQANTDYIQDQRSKKTPKRKHKQASKYTTSYDL